MISTPLKLHRLYDGGGSQATAGPQNNSPMAPKGFSRQLHGYLSPAASRVLGLRPHLLPAGRTNVDIPQTQAREQSCGGERRVTAEGVMSSATAHRMSGRTGRGSDWGSASNQRLRQPGFPRDLTVSQVGSLGCYHKTHNQVQISALSPTSSLELHDVSKSSFFPLITEES